MKRLLLCLYLLPLLAFAQGEFNQWRFGYNAGMAFNGFSPSPVTNSAISTPEGSASVADCDGNLLFYTDGETVWSSNNSRMSNGFDLRGVGASYPVTQSALIVKRPKSQSIYYIFTASDLYGVNYSVVNMQANSGLGAVVQKNIQLSASPTHKLGVTYHANEEDVWVVTHYENSRVYESFLITPIGVASSGVKSSTGPEFRSAHGDLKINQQGTKVAAVVQDDDLVSLADFDNLTGQVSNGFGVINDYRSPHGCEFSPLGNKLYVTAWGSGGGVFQFNVSSSNAQTLSSSIDIAGTFVPNGSLQLAPNGKIYVAHTGDLFFPNRTLGVINSPNNTGSAVNFNRNGFFLGSGSASSWELPNVTLTSKIVDLPTLITASQFCVNTPTSFSFNNQNAAIDVLWDFDDPNSGITNYSTQFEPIHNFSAPGTYNVKVTITTSCDVIELTEQIEIEGRPVLDFDSTEFCPDATSQIIASAESGVLYSWSPAANLSSATIIDPQFNSTGFRDSVFMYTITAESSTNCTSTDTLYISILPKYTSDDSLYVCPGSGTELNFSEEIIAVTWGLGQGISDLNSPSPYVMPLVSTDYAAVVEDTNGCVYNDTVPTFVSSEVPVDAGIDQSACLGDTLYLGNNISPDSTQFSWLPGSDFIVSDSVYGLIKAKNSGWYYLEVSNDTCTGVDSMFLTVDPLPVFNIVQSDSSVCLNDSVVLSSTSNDKHTWIQNDIVIGSLPIQLYISQATAEVVLRITDVNSCVAYDTVAFDLLSLPAVDVSPDTSLCLGDSMEISVSGAPSYVWTENNIQISTDSNLLLKPTVTTIYYLEAIGGNNCITRDSVELKVNPLPNINLFADSVICKGTPAFLWATGGLNYTWYPIDSVVNSNNAFTTASPKVNTLYKVVVETNQGCVDSATSSISLNDVPVADFTYTLLPVCDGIFVDFTNTSTLSTGYAWDFGEGTSTTEVSPENTFGYGSNSTVTLLANNNNICFDTLSLGFSWQEAKNAIDVFVPNIITPNGDGVNDCFEYDIPQEFDNCTSYQLFNRWGMLVYDTKEFKGTFCGINGFNNKSLSEGTYFYVMKVGEYAINGFLTIQR